MTLRRIVIAVTFVVACAAQLPAQVEFAGPPEKRLLEYGWDVPRPTFVAEHIREMEQRPFDGLLMRVPRSGRFSSRPGTKSRPPSWPRSRPSNGIASPTTF